MTLTKNQFFLVATIFCMLAAFAQRIWWFSTAKCVTAEVWFIGHGNLGSSLGLSTYEVLRFVVDNDTIVVNNDLYLRMKEGQQISVLYQPDDPHDAKVNSLTGIWGEPLVYSLWPILVLVVLYLVPDIFPKKSKIVVGGRKVRRIEE